MIVVVSRAAIEQIEKAQAAAELEKCAYCGARVETPCDEPPPDTCETALNAVHGT